MNAQVFTAKTSSIFSDNAGRRMVGRQASGSGVDEARIALLGAGDYRVFKRPRDHKFKSWRVDFMVDCSGSMMNSGDKVSYSAKSLFQLSKALREAGIGEVSITGFNQVVSPIKAEECKTEEMTYKTLIKLVDNRSTYGGNHDGYALRKVMERSLLSPKPGKVIFVLSDGQPHCDDEPNCGHEGCGYNAFQREQLMGAAHDARKKGIIVLGLGMMVSHLKEYFGEGYTASIMQMESLFKEAARLLERNIIRG